MVTVLVAILLMATASMLALPEKRSDLDPEPKNYLRIETDRDVYEKGEDVTIRLFLVNTRNESVTFSFNNTFNGTYQWEMTISDSNGRRVETWIDSI